MVNSTTHRILGSFFLLVAMSIGYMILTSIVKIEISPDTMNDYLDTENAEPTTIYVNPLTLLFVGEVQISEAMSRTLSFPYRLYMMLHIVLMVVYAYQALAQFRLSNVNSFIRILTVLPIVSKLTLILTITYASVLGEKDGLFDSFESIFTLLLAIVGLFIGLILCKPNTTESEVHSAIQEASIGTRFIHNIVDRSGIIVFFLLGQIVFLFQVSSGSSYFRDMDTEKIATLKDFFLLAISAIILLGIGIFEAVSHSSPGKLFTGYSIQTTHQKPLSIGRIILRTLCRVIPFDAWSFLFQKNWHDQISKTKLTYTSDVPWLKKQATWMHKLAWFFMIICIIGFVAFILDFLLKERAFDFIGLRHISEIFSYYWQVALLFIFIFILIHSGFSAALMHYTERLWNNESEDSASHLFIALFSWVPVLGWIVCSRPSSEIETEIGTKHFDTQQSQEFESAGRALRGSMRLYHILWLLILLGICTTRWSETALMYMVFLLMVSFFFISIFWFNYTKRLTEAKEIVRNSEEEHTGVEH